MTQKIIKQEINKLPEQEGQETSYEMITVVEHTVVVKKSELETQLKQRDAQLKQVTDLRKEIEVILEKVNQL